MADIKKEQEREELHRAIWAIADDLRGAVDGWDFKNYVLGTMFYRYISENLTSYINTGEADAGNPNIPFRPALCHISLYLTQLAICFVSRSRGLIGKVGWIDNLLSIEEEHVDDVCKYIVVRFECPLNFVFFCQNLLLKNFKIYRSAVIKTPHT